MASITCGNCHKTHESVEQVKGCHGLGKPKNVAVTDGYYKLIDDIYKVQYNRNGTHMYAKILVVIDNGDGTYGGRFDYVPGAINSLTGGMRLTQEEAAQFGQLYGICCICGLTLTNEESIELGIGPICRQKQGWG